MVLASARTDVANFLATLIYVYILVIFLYVVIQMLFSVGIRPPYSRWTDVVLGFLHDVAEPFLRIFRRVLPRTGAIDLSPMAAIITLYVIKEVVVLRIIGG
jgi:YggT family protein